MESDLLVLMVVRLMSHGQSLLPELPAMLAVDPQSAVHGVGLAVVLEDPAHVVQ